MKGRRSRQPTRQNPIRQMRLVLTERPGRRPSERWLLDPETRSRGLAGVAAAREKLRRAS